MKLNYLLIILSITSIFLINGVFGYSATANVSLTNSIGVIPNYYYGSGGQDALTSYNNVSDDVNSCTRNITSNYTKERQAFLDTGVRIVRYDMNINSHIDSGLNLYGMERFQELFQWANQTGVKIIFIIDEMSTYLANMTIAEAPCDKSGGYSCPPKNYTYFGEMLVNYINVSTNYSQFINQIDSIEVWNEPEYSFLTNLTDDAGNATIRSKYYNMLYNQSYISIKNAYPNIAIIGPTISFQSVGYITIRNNFLSNFSNQMNGVSFHSYTTSSGSFSDFDSRVSTIYSRCVQYNANCSRIYFDEWNYQPTQADLNGAKHGAYYSYMFTQGLRNYTFNMTMIPFKFSTTYRNLSCDVDSNFSQYSQLTGMKRLSYNITSMYANNHKIGNSRLLSYTNDSNLTIVASTDGDKYYITLTNTNSTMANITLGISLSAGRFIDVETGTNYTISNNQVIINNLNGYGVLTLRYENDLTFSVVMTGVCDDFSEGIGSLGTPIFVVIIIFGVVLVIGTIGVLILVIKSGNYENIKIVYIMGGIIIGLFVLFILTFVGLYSARIICSIS